MKIVKFTNLEAIIKNNGNKLLVINFWATWCKPCVEELPGFMEVNKMYANNPGFKMILVSLDVAKESETKVRPFILKNKINTEVYLLDDNKRMNEWIPAIDKNWSGAIPATVFYRNGKKLEFIENKMHKNELIQIISKYL
ncbi:MAG: TlpA disulfide reductase family protein [Paludibacter sp.]